MGERGSRTSRLRTVCSEEYTNLRRIDSLNGCKRGRWCLFGRWEQILVPDEFNHPMTKNTMECRISMNHFPTTKTSRESVFSTKGSGPWMTAIESYGGTLDSLVEGPAHQAGEDIDGRFYTGNEEFLPGDDIAYEDLEVQLEEVTRGMHPSVAALLEDLVFRHGCRIVAVHPDLIECSDDDVARDIVIRERTMGEPIWPREPICPCFLHPALVFIPDFAVVRKYISLLLDEGLGAEAAKAVTQISRNIENRKGNLRDLLKDPREMTTWIAIKKMVIKRYLDRL